MNPAGPDAEAAAAIAPLLAGCYGAIFEGVEGPDVATAQSPHFVSGRTPVEISDFNRIMVRSVAADPSDAEVDGLLAGLDGVTELSCWLPPGDHQAAIAGRFGGRGFGGGSGPGVPTMWIETAGLAAGPLPSGVTIERVVSPELSDLMVRVAVDGFGAPPQLEAPMASLFRPMVTQPAWPARAFLARLDGRAVATALGVVSGDAVGIYNVATVPDARGRGIGGAVTLAAICDGRDRGARVAVLESSEMGFPVYQRLGFTVAARYQVLTRHGG